MKSNIYSNSSTLNLYNINQYQYLLYYITIYILIIQLQFSIYIQCDSTGATICDAPYSMSNGQSGTGGFTVNFSPLGSTNSINSYIGGQQYTVQLSSTIAYRGFLVQSVTGSSAGATWNSGGVGTFSYTSTTLYAKCSYCSNRDSSVGHTYTRNRNPVTSDTWTWTAPTAGTGTVTFLAIGVVTERTWYGGATKISTTITEAVAATVAGAPTAVSATAGNAQAAVSFTAPASNGGAAITGYTVTSTPAGGTHAASATSPITVTGLTNGVSYTFTVKATNSVGDSAASAASSAVTPTGPPGAPTAVSATAGNTQATVTFTTPASNGGSPITGYTVTSTPGGLTGTSSGATSINVLGLTNGVSYTFTVKATNAAGTGVASAATAAVTPAGAATSPTNVVAVSHDSSVFVSWSAPVSTGNGGSSIANYTIHGTPGSSQIVTSATVHNATVTGLTNGVQYTFTVTVTNSVGNSTTSSASNAVTPAAVPTAPTNVVATRGNNAATVTFTASSTNNGATITSYTVTSTPGNIVATATSAAATTVTGLTNGVFYTFVVRAINSAGTSAASAASNSIAPGIPPATPTAPVLVDAFAVNSNLIWTIGWSYNASTVSYFLLESQTNGGAFTLVYNGTNMKTNTSSLPMSTPIAFRLTAFNVIASDVSALLTLTTPTSISQPAAPSTPALLSGTGTSVSLSWSAPVSVAPADILYYQVSYKQTSDASYTFLTVANTTSYTVSAATLVGGNNYTFQITAITTAGVSAAATISYAVAGCPNNCNGHGTCTSSLTCSCSSGYLGSDCSIYVSASPTCSFSFCWNYAVNVTNNIIYFRFTAPANVWAGFLFGSSDGMTGGKGYYFTQSTNPYRPIVSPICDAVRDGIPTICTGADDLLSVSSFIIGSQIDISFQRTLSASTIQSYTFPTTAGNPITIAYAIGPNTDITADHGSNSRKYAKYDIITGTSTTIDDASKIFYIGIGIALAIIGIGGILLHFLIGSSALGYILLHKRMMKPIKPFRSALIDFIFMSIPQQLTDLSIAELFVILLYIAGTIVTAIIGSNQFANKQWSLIFGHMICYHLSLTMIPITRHSIWSFLFGTSFDRIVKFHRWIARSTMIFLCLHLAYEIKEKTNILDDDQGITGILAFICFALLFVSAIEPIRRHLFELFWYIHVIIAPLALIISCIHTIWTLIWCIIPIILYIIDQSWRCITQLKEIQCINASVINTNSQDISTRITKLDLQIDGLKYHPGAYIFISISQLSWFQSHPFSITTAPSTNTNIITLMIKSEQKNSWTAELAKLIQSGIKPIIRYNGPYGSLSYNIYQCNRLFLCAGGIGITPILSILAELYYHAKQQSLGNIKSIHLIWVAQSTILFDTLASELLNSIMENNINSIFHIHLYNTARHNNASAATATTSSATGIRTVAPRPLPPIPTQQQQQQLPPHQYHDRDTELVTLHSIATSPHANNYHPGLDATALTIPIATHTSSTVTLSSSITIHSGRPNYQQLFSLSSNLDNSSSSSMGGVIVCGPDTLIHHVQNCALDNKFLFHKEIFKF